jgi:hypothetical protein
MCIRRNHPPIGTVFRFRPMAPSHPEKCKRQGLTLRADPNQTKLRCFWQRR